MTEAHDFEEFNSGSEIGFFEFKNFLIWISSACSFDLIFVHIWA